MISICCSRFSSWCVWVFMVIRVIWVVLLVGVLLVFIFELFWVSLVVLCSWFSVRCCLFSSS